MSVQNWLRQRKLLRQVSRFAQSEAAQYYTPPDINTIKEQSFAASDFLVLDFETTGLNAKKNQLLSVGFTTITKARVQLGKSEHYYMRYRGKIPDSTIAIHHITEQEAAQGIRVKDLFPFILKRLSGKILVAHFADIEVGFLQKIAQSLYGVELPLLVVDTLQIAFHMKYKGAVHVPQDALNLFTLREHYQLPRYKAHNAMVDAVSTAELLLILVDELGGEDSVTVEQLIKFH